MIYHHQINLNLDPKIMPKNLICLYFIHQVLSLIYFKLILFYWNFTPYVKKMVAFHREIAGGFVVVLVWKSARKLVFLSQVRRSASKRAVGAFRIWITTSWSFRFRTVCRYIPEYLCLRHFSLNEGLSILGRLFVYIWQRLIKIKLLGGRHLQSVITSRIILSFTFTRHWTAPFIFHRLVKIWLVFIILGIFPQCFRIWWHFNIYFFIYFVLNYNKFSFCIFWNW